MPGLFRAVTHTQFGSPQKSIFAAKPVHIMQDNGDAQFSAIQDIADAQVVNRPEGYAAVVSGNGNSSQLHEGQSVKHQPPSYPFFSADNARMYPEWSLPEPVAVPHNVNGLWGPSWLQQPEAAPQQAQAQRTTEPAEAYMPPIASALASQPQAEREEAAQPQMPQPVCTLLPEAQHAAADTQPTSVSEVVSTQDAEPAGVSAEEQLLYSSVPQASLAQRSTALLQQDAGASQQVCEPTQPSATQEDPAAVQQDMHLERQQEQQQELSQHRQQQWQQQEQPLDHQQQLQHSQQEPQQLLMQAPSAGDGQERHQQAGAGPSDTGQVTIGPNVGAYSQREVFLQNLEQAGDMSFEYVLNDGQRHNSIWSVAAACLGDANTCSTRCHASLMPCLVTSSHCMQPSMWPLLFLNTTLPLCRISPSTCTCSVTLLISAGQ